MFWRLIDDKAHGASFNMALDEAVSEAVRKKISPPTLRLYQWAKPSITIGYFQKFSDINLKYCKKKSYPVARRLTGGMAILHDSELTYSFSACNDIKPFKNNLINNYLSVSKALVSALRLINIDAQITLSKSKRESRNDSIPRDPFCFKISSYGEITVDGTKIIGSAQKRYSNGFLQQGSIMIDFDVKELGRVLGYYNQEENFHETNILHSNTKNNEYVIARDEIPKQSNWLDGVSAIPKDEIVSPPARNDRKEEFSDKIGTIRKYAPAVSIKKLRKALRKAFEKTFNIEFISGGPTEFELTLAKKLEREKYSSEEWNFCR